MNDSESILLRFGIVDNPNFSCGSVGKQVRAVKLYRSSVVECILSEGIQDAWIRGINLLLSPS